MLDDSALGFKVFEGEDEHKEIRKFISHWKKVTSNHPERFNHESSNNVCPICGKQMMQSKGNPALYWCINCEYESTNIRPEQ